MKHVRDPRNDLVQIRRVSLGAFVKDVVFYTVREVFCSVCGMSRGG